MKYLPPLLSFFTRNIVGSLPCKVDVHFSARLCAFLIFLHFAQLSWQRTCLPSNQQESGTFIITQHSIALRDDLKRLWTKSFAIFFSHFITDCFNFKSVFLSKQNEDHGYLTAYKKDTSEERREGEKRRPEMRLLFAGYYSYVLYLAKSKLTDHVS